MSNFVLGTDVWEGNPNLDEAVLKAAGVSFMIVRLNHMDGGHHMDVNFLKQWEEAASFLRIPYFVLNPWVSGKENYEWLAAHVPDVKAIAVDVEVRMPGLSPADYSQILSDFLGLADRKWRVMIYTGAWFTPLISQWPSNHQYWWARYPGVLYPPATELISWGDLRKKLDGLKWTPGPTPGPCNLWQCTADRYKLPGCGGTHVDINIWNGTLDELAEWAGQPLPAVMSLKDRVRRLEVLHGL
jgi:hypothetical protein